jgi:hypothetical protein
VIKREREKNQTGIGITPAVEAGVLSGSWLWSLRSHASLDEFGVNLGRVFGPRTGSPPASSPKLADFPWRVFVDEADAHRHSSFSQTGSSTIWTVSSRTRFLTAHQRSDAAAAYARARRYVSRRLEIDTD